MARSSDPDRSAPGPPKVLDIGCGTHKRGTVGMDAFPAPCVDVVHDLRQVPWPFEDASFDRVEAHQVLEHIPREGAEHDEVLFRVMAEAHRVLKPGGSFGIDVPHEESPHAMGNPFHHRTFNEWSFLYFVQKGPGQSHAFPSSARVLYSSLRQRVEHGFMIRGKNGEYHLKKYVPRIYRLYCWIGFGRKSTLFVELIK
jgi:SAM-dependent methyltransferase